MPVEKAVGNSLVEVIDRILDKGIVIDAWVSVSVIGIELITIEARVIVASVETYVKYAGVLGYIGPIAGGLREPTQRKTLGEGLEDISKGLGKGLKEVPLVGDVSNQAQGLVGGVTGGRKRQPQAMAAGRQTSASKSGSLRGKTTKKSSSAKSTSRSKSRKKK